jgi:hypothetical protein
MMDINILAVLAAAVASMVIGSIWYGPMFGKMYMSLMGMEQWSAEKKAEMKKGMTMTYVIQFVASVVMFFVIAWLMAALGKTDVQGGLEVAIWTWVGFIVTTKLGDAIWGGKMRLFWLGIGGSLITFVVGAVILGMWK